MAATMCMTAATATTSNASLLTEQNDLNSNHKERIPFSEEPYFFDAEDLNIPARPGRVMHLSMDYQTIGKWEKGKQPVFIASSKVNTLLSDLDYNLFVGKSETFNTLTRALTTVEKMQRIEALQPKFAWKPLDVIKKTLENTTQWGECSVNSQ